MHWLFSAMRLKSRGVLGMNARNLSGILGHNPRALYPLVDDKLRFWEQCARLDLPTPTVYGTIDRHGDLRHLRQFLDLSPAAAIKPARGSSGRGILLLSGREEMGYRRHNGEVMDVQQVRCHISDILSGMHSLGGRPDRAMIQRLVGVHATFAEMTYLGTPDLRILVYRGLAAMAMLRLPTRESQGRANLHQGGVGVGIELRSGRTTRAICRGHAIDRHPDTTVPLRGLEIPEWNRVLDLSTRLARATGLGFLGVDIVLDPEEGPLILEANVRPGLAIQIANGQGLRGVLQEIDGRIRGEGSPCLR
jgi:alpha-L-glutamate ligase-like protein